MVNDSILDRIRHLLALGEHPASNPNEAAVALEKAQSLLLQHNLTRSSIIAPDEPQAPQGIGRLNVTEATGYVWRKALLNTIAKHNLCRVIGNTAHNTSTVFGTRDNVRAVLEMYYWVAEQLERLANSGLREYNRSGGHEHGRTWKAGFYYGATATIKDRLSAPLEAFTQGEGRGLVLASNAHLETAIHKIYPYIHASRRTVPLGDGYGAGKRAGAGVSFGRPRSPNGNRLALASGS